MYDTALGFLKKAVSFGVLVFSIVVVSATIFDEQTLLSRQVNGPFAFCAMWLALMWLARVEGSQATMVGLPPVDRELYKESHPIAFRVCEYGHRGDNLDRYLMGRQFMVLALVFVINMAGAPADAEGADRHTAVSEVFVNSGLAMILFTAMMGQLNTQVTASYCMLDYSDSHFQMFTLYATMAIEASGLLHASYLIQMIVAKMAGSPIESNEPPRNWWQNLLFWGRVALSVIILGFAFYLTLTALFQGKTTAWESVPTTVSVVMLFVLMGVVGMLEGMQIAFFAVSRITEKERKSNRWAKWSCDLLFGDTGRGLAGFLIGRQLCVAACFFGIARITTIDVQDGEENLLGVDDRLQRFFETGLLGALITTIVASLAWQLVASAFPVAFLGNPVAHILLRICLILEATGVCSFAWVLSEIHQEFLGFLDDVEYIGTAEERSAQGKGDRKRKERGHLTGGAFPANFGQTKRQHHGESVSFDELVGHIADLKKKASEAKTEEERNALLEEVEALEKMLTGRKPHNFRTDSGNVLNSATELEVPSDDNV